MISFGYIKCEGVEIKYDRTTSAHNFDNFVGKLLDENE